VKILLGLERESEAQALAAELEMLKHKTVIGLDLDECVKLLRHWRPDMIVVDERIRRDQPESGLRLAELSRLHAEGSYSSSGTRVLVLLPTADWNRMRRAQFTGAHAIVKGTNFNAVVRSVEASADNLITDRLLGPVLLGVHRFSDRLPHRLCKTCKWERASVCYGMSEAEIDLTPIRTAILNALFWVRRGQSATEIAWTVSNSAFLQAILRSRLLKETAVKMEISRIRDSITKALERIGAPYNGCHFLPPVPHGVGRYRLGGNWAVQHYLVDIARSENARTAIASRTENR